MEKIKPFIRISWQEAMEILEKGLHEKYKAEGKIILKKDWGYDGIGDFYESPTFVDIELNK
jgi:hypothetical protein